MAKNMLCEVTVTFNHRNLISSSLSSSGCLCQIRRNFLKAFLRNHVHDGRMDNGHGCCSHKGIIITTHLSRKSDLVAQNNETLKIMTQYLKILTHNFEILSHYFEKSKTLF